MMNDSKIVALISALSKTSAIKYGASNFSSFEKKSENADGSQTWTIIWLNNGVSLPYDITFPKGVNGYKGVYTSKTLLESSYSTGLTNDEFALVEDSSTENIYLSTYDSGWVYKRLNNKVVFKRVGEYLKYKFDDEDDTQLRIICSMSDLKGDKGEQGIQGNQGIKGDSAYDTAVNKESFSGTEVEWLESLNSCIGKFTSLADLKIAYPSGIDPYKFAIISTTTGQVGIAFYDKSVSNWQVTVFASTNGSAVVTDDKSIGKNSLGNLQINGFEDANSDTVVSKNSSGEVKYIGIEKSNTNNYSTIASKEYVDESIVGGISIQNSYYNASTNTPDITTINTGGKSFAWIVLVAGTQTLGGISMSFNVYDLVIKTSSSAYLKIQNGTVSWGSIIGDITQQTDLINKLNEYAKIDDADITSATKTYSIKHILELEDKKRKIFMQSDSPVDMAKDDLWIDTTSIPYLLSSYNGIAWVSVGAAAGTKINDWVSSTAYKIGEYIVHNSLLYRCTIANSDATFTSANWILISGHMIKDSSSMYTKRTNLQFTGDGVSITDDVNNDNTVITIKGDVTKTGTETLTNKTLIDFNTKIANNIDNTKIAQFDTSKITTGTTRTVKVPDKDGIIALMDSTTENLPINGFTKLGSDAPSIKIKKITGNMPSLGQSIYVPHGLTNSKIINFSCVVRDTENNIRMPNSTNGQDIEYYLRIKADNSSIWLTSGLNAILIAGRPFTVVIMYEE